MTWWQAYSWVYSILTALGLLTLLPVISSLNFASWEGVFEGAILAIGTYSFAYKRHILPKNAWKIVIILILGVWIVQFIYYSNIFPMITPSLKFLEIKPPQGFWTIFFSMILSFPALLSLYKLGFIKTKKNSS